MRILKYIIFVLLFLIVAGFFALRTEIVQMTLVEMQAERILERPSPLPEEDSLSGLLCGSRGPLPSAGTAETCILIKAGERIFIVDAGDGSITNLRDWGIDLGKIEAFLLTHTHSDHFSDLADLHLNAWVTQNRTDKLKVYGPEGTQSVTDGFEATYALDYKWRYEHHGNDVAPIEFAGFDTHIIDIESSIVIEDDDLRVTAFLVDHDPVKPSIGYRFDYKGRSITISGDTSYSENVIKHADKTDLLFHEALSYRLNKAGATAAYKVDETGNISTVLIDVLDYHTSPTQAARAAQLAKAKHLIFYHLIPYPEGLVAKMLFFDGVNDIYKNWKIGRDGVMGILPLNSDKVKITYID